MASQANNKTRANLLRNSLQKPADACPEPEILAAYFERSLDSEEKKRYELHLSECARCREQLAAMYRADEPALGHATQPHGPSRWAWLWDWRWLAPAAAVLVIAAIWTARRPISKPASESSAPPLVAMNRPAEPTQAPMPAPRPEQHSNFVSRIPNKTLVAPDAGAAGAVKQSPALTESHPAENDKELASNQPTLATATNALDDLKRKDEQSVRRDSAGAEIGVASGATPSRMATPAAVAPAPAARAAGPTQAEGGVIGGLIADQAVAANQSPATKAKPSGSPTGVRTLTQQAQTQTVMQSRALELEAADRRSTAIIIPTPDPKVRWRIAGGGVVELSKDGGTTWQSQQLRSFQANPLITAGNAPTAKICWLVGRDGVILLTRDAEHWVPIPPPLSVDFVGVIAKDNFSATVTAADGRKFSTDDAGDHWNPVP